jgi:hypothetical protein
MYGAMVELLAWALILYIIVSFFLARAIANDGGDIPEVLYVGFGWPIIIIISIGVVCRDWYRYRE